MQRAGYQVSIVGPNTDDRKIDGIKVYGVALNPHPLYRMFLGARKIYKRALELDADVYHFHDVELFHYGLKLKRKGKKVIFDSHEDWPNYVKEIKWLPKIIRFGFACLLHHWYSACLHKFDYVITVSPHIVGHLLKDNPKTTCDIVANYPIVDKELLTQSLERERMLCYIGTVYSFSNQETILRAIEHIETTYFVAGQLSDTMREKLKVLPAYKKMEFLGMLSKERVKKLLAHVGVGIVLFDYTPNCGGKEGTLGNTKLFEYMMAGLPIICTDFKLWKERIVDKYKCGIVVPPGDVRSLTNAIETLLNNQTLRFEMGNAALQAVKVEFNWATQEQVLIDIYSKL